jgi:Chromo (CHRromatin Organisation MOdifier) domain
MSKRSQREEIILIEEEPDVPVAPERKSHTNERVAQRIVSKERSSNGTRFLVRWVGSNEETWESDETMRHKYPDLVDDYEFHRQSDQRVKDKPERSVDRGSRKAVKQAGKSSLID